MSPKSLSPLQFVKYSSGQNKVEEQAATTFPPAPSFLYLPLKLAQSTEEGTGGRLTDF